MDGQRCDGHDAKDLFERGIGNGMYRNENGWSGTRVE